MKNKLYAALLRACAIFTALQFVFYIAAYAVGVGGTPAMNLKMIASLFIFSLFFSYSFLIFDIRKMSPAVKRILHCLICVVSFLLVYIGVIPEEKKGSQIVVCVVLTLIVYVIVSLVAGLVKKALKKDED